MKVLFRLAACAALFAAVLVTVIKIVQGCSFKEAVGIAEEIWKEVTEPFLTCRSRRNADEAEETGEADA